jgi:hypothetical protein
MKQGVEMASYGVSGEAERADYHQWRFHPGMNDFGMVNALWLDRRLCSGAKFQFRHRISTAFQLTSCAQSTDEAYLNWR